MTTSDGYLPRNHPQLKEARMCTDREDTSPTAAD